MQHHHSVHRCGIGFAASRKPSHHGVFCVRARLVLRTFHWKLYPVWPGHVRFLPRHSLQELPGKRPGRGVQFVSPRVLYRRCRLKIASTVSAVPCKHISTGHGRCFVSTVHSRLLLPVCHVVAAEFHFVYADWCCRKSAHHISIQFYHVVNLQRQCRLHGDRFEFCVFVGLFDYGVV